MTSPRPLTEASVLALAEIIHAARRGARTRRAVAHGGVISGVARHIVTNPDTAVFLGPNDEVCDGYLRVSGTFEHFWPISELLPEVVSGELSFEED